MLASLPSRLPTRPLHRVLLLTAVTSFVLLATWRHDLYLPTKTIDAVVMPPPAHHDRLRALERSLPQHNLNLPFPEGRTGRYIWFNVQPRGQGWNNILAQQCVAALALFLCDKPDLF
jgi:hypothetical protein